MENNENGSKRALQIAQAAARGSCCVTLEDRDNWIVEYAAKIMGVEFVPVAPGSSNLTPNPEDARVSFLREVVNTL